MKTTMTKQAKIVEGVIDSIVDTKRFQAALDALATAPGTKGADATMSVTFDHDTPRGPKLVRLTLAMVDKGKRVPKS